MSRTEATHHKLPSKFENLKIIAGNLTETASRAAEQFRPAVISSWFYTSIGLLSGFLALGLQKGLEALLRKYEAAWYELVVEIIHLIAFVSEHLGIGLIVAAIAVFFYEWRAQIKEAMELSRSLAKSLSQIEAIKTIIERGDELIGSIKQTEKIMEALGLTEKLYKDLEKSASLNLSACLRSSIGGPSKGKETHLTNAVESCEKLIKAIGRLRADNQWANNKYIEFIIKQIDEFVGHNADAFSDLKLNRGAQKFRVPPTAAGMAVEILALQMEVMKEGDRYDVVSDLTSWRDVQLGKLLEKTEDAITNNNVKVRRVFNFLPYVWRTYEKKPPHDVKQILMNHLQASQDWKGTNGEGSYQIKILWPHEYDAKLRTDHRVRNIIVPILHFGLFIHKNESIKFSVTKPDLSDMELSRQANDNDDTIIFKALWEAAIDFPAEGTIEDRVNRVILELSSQRASDL